MDVVPLRLPVSDVISTEKTMIISDLETNLNCGVDVMKEIYEDHPERFGSSRNFSSGFSMTNFCWTAGMLVGPVLSGFLTRSVGYYYMNLTCGKSLVLSSPNKANILS